MNKTARLGFGALIMIGAAVAACDDAGVPITPVSTPAPPAGQAGALTARGGDEFTTEFHLERCHFRSSGRNPFFVLEPGYTLVLESEEGAGEEVVLRIRVTDHTLRIGGIDARIVEERETVDGALVEVSRNYFALCDENGGIFYFGEDVDIYESGHVVSHDGSWRHGVAGARAGLMMPGLPLLGSRYYQEIAPRVALDRAEITSLDEDVRTPFRRFRHALLARETTPLDPGAEEFKAYGLDVGLIRDGDLFLVSAGRE